VNIATYSIDNYTAHQRRVFKHGLNICKMCCHSRVLLVIFKNGNCIMNNTEKTVVKVVLKYLHTE